MIDTGVIAMLALRRNVKTIFPVARQIKTAGEYRPYFLAKTATDHDRSVSIYIDRTGKRVTGWSKFLNFNYFDAI